MWSGHETTAKPPPRHVYCVIHSTVLGKPLGFRPGGGGGGGGGGYPELSRVLLVNASRGWFNYNIIPDNTCCHTRRTLTSFENPMAWRESCISLNLSAMVGVTAPSKAVPDPTRHLLQQEVEMGVGSVLIL